MEDAASHAWGILHPLLPGPKSVKLMEETVAVGRHELGTSRKLVSKCHMRIQRSAGGSSSPASITDSSVNGTFLNGEKLAREEPRELNAGDIITLLTADSTDFVFVYVATTPAGKIDASLVKMVRKLTAPPSKEPTSVASSASAAQPAAPATLPSRHPRRHPRRQRQMPGLAAVHHRQRRRDEPSD